MRILIALAVAAAATLATAGPALADEPTATVPLPGGHCIIVETTTAFTVYECTGVPRISLPNHL